MYHLARINLNFGNIFRLNSKVRIPSSCLFKNIERLKSNDVAPTLNKNIAAVSKAAEILKFSKSQIKDDKVRWSEQLILKSSPQIQPYLRLMRIDKPIGSWLLFWPCSWSVAMAASPGCWPDPYLLTLFGIGSLVMRGAGCTINDMWDKDLDSRVARTKDRPLVSGVISMPQALTFLAAQLSVGLMVLLQLNWYTIFLGSTSLALVAIYPLAKRITYWPQMALGLTFNWGIFVGYSAVHGYVDWPLILPLYTAAVFWTVIYDTIYAHQDIVDDLVAGVKSTAIKFKEDTKKWLTAFASIMTGSLATAGVVAEQTLPYYISVALVSSHLAWQIYTLDIKNSKDCGSKFISNAHLGFLLFLGITFGNLLKEKRKIYIVEDNV